MNDLTQNHSTQNASRATETPLEAASQSAGSQADVHHVGEPIVFEGYADDFEHGVAAIEFSLDNGATWTAYSTADSIDEVGLSWRFAYTPTQPGCYLLKARAVSKQGETSPLVSGFAFEVLP